MKHVLNGITVFLGIRGSRGGLVLSGLLILLGMGCDHSVPLSVNSKKEYVVSTSCGDIRVGTFTFSNVVFVHAAIKGNGIVLDQDMLRVDYVPADVSTDDNRIVDIRFEVDHKSWPEKKMEVNGARDIQVAVKLEKTYRGGRIRIFPGNFITCGGAGLIKDTISIMR